MRHRCAAPGNHSSSRLPRLPLLTLFHPLAPRLPACSVRRDISRGDNKGLDIFVCGDQVSIDGMLLLAAPTTHPSVRWPPVALVGCAKDFSANTATHKRPLLHPQMCPLQIKKGAALNAVQVAELLL